MKQVIAECKMKYNGFSHTLTIDNCRELFNCNKHDVNCYSCPCFNIKVEENRGK